MDTFAAFIPMGPGADEALRIVDLLNSIFIYEPAISHVIIVSDDASLSLLSNLSPPNTCVVTVLTHPAPGSKLRTMGGLCVADLTALKFAHEHTTVRFVVKLDTDSLVIAPFSGKMEHAFSSNPNVGILGVLGTSCNPENCSFEYDRRVAQLTTRGVALGLRLDRLAPDDVAFLGRWGITTTESKKALRQVARRLEPILHTNFAGAHPQGGAYAVSERLISRLASMGLLEVPPLWLELPIGEDQMMGILSALAGLQVMSFSNRNEPFGIQAIGLAYAPLLLARYGYSIIHSVKNDSHYSESYIRKFFVALRELDCRGRAGTLLVQPKGIVGT